MLINIVKLQEENKSRVFSDLCDHRVLCVNCGGGGGGAVFVDGSQETICSMEIRN